MSFATTAFPRWRLSLPASPSGWLLALATLTVLVLCVVVRIRYLSVPFERDEGEYAYAAQLILAGLPPYAEAYNMKMPGIYYAYALLIAVFGETHAAIHAGLLVINLVTALGVFLLGRWLAGARVGAIASAVFAVLSLGQAVTGVFANAEHFVLPFAVFGVLLVLRGLENMDWRRLAAGGLLLGVGFLMKQHALAYVALALALCAVHGLAQREWRSAWRGGALVLCGAALPLLLLVLAMYLVGMAEQFFFWTFAYASAYVNVVPAGKAWAYFLEGLLPVVTASWPLWLTALVAAVCWPFGKLDALRRSFVPLGIVFGLLATVPGFYFRNHYFLLPLPMVAVASGAGCWLVGQWCLRWAHKPVAGAAMAAVFLVTTAGALWEQREYLATMTPMQMSRASYGLNPFPESLTVADYINRNTAPTDRIAVIGSEPQIYFYAQRRAATGYIYMYPLMEPQPYALSMQRQMITEVESHAPRFIVLVGVHTSWLMRATSERTVLQWAQQYIADRYEQVGVVDITPWGTRFVWDAAAASYDPHSNVWMKIYRRRA